MINISKMQGKIDKFLSVFTNLIGELNGAIGELNGAIVSNNEAIKRMEDDNVTYEEKIKEYETLKSNVENIIK